MTDTPMIDELSIFKGTTYHGIEYSHTRDTSLHMKTCGFQRCMPGYAYPRAAREGYHLHVVLAGKGVLQVGDRKFAIHEGQFFLLKDREEVFYQADLEAPWHYAWVTFSGELAPHYMQCAGFTDGVYVLDCHVPIMEFLTIVKNILERPHLTPSSEIYRASLALRFLSLAIESWERSKEDSTQDNDMTTDDYVDYAVRFMESNFSSIKVSDVADYIGINRTYLTSIFKKKMLMSPQEYLMQMKMTRSMDLLRQTDAPIHVIAEEVGYEDQLAFSKMFKKKYGLSPEQYRKKIRGERSS
ncbi:MAG: AraC family transcriptional regulator [Clostridia bacterium]|nr:AraC family transcriptional regulator [Clostridia bacterium]